MYKIKYLIGKTIIGSSYQKRLLLSKFYISYYPEPHSYITVKIKVVLDLPIMLLEKNYPMLQVLIHQI